MPSNQSRFNDTYQNTTRIGQIFIILQLLMQLYYFRLIHRLEQISFQFSYTLQIVGTMPILLSTLPINSLSIPPIISKSLSLAIIVITFPATVIRPTNALLHLIRSCSTPLNRHGLRMVTQSALGLSLPTLAITLLLPTNFITPLIIYNFTIAIALVAVIILAKTPAYQVRSALLPSIGLTSASILIAKLISTNLPITILAVTLYILTFLTITIFAWCTTALITLASQINQPPIHPPHTHTT